MHSEKRTLFVLLVLIGAAILTACESEPEQVEVTRVVTEKEKVVETVVETVIEKETVVKTVVETVVEKETVVKKETVIQKETVVLQPTDEPVQEGPRTLVICAGQEPDTLYWYGGSMLAARHVYHAIYDGPIDNRTFDYQPIILEKLPSLADGDTVIETVTVEAGDPIVDDNGDPVVLEEGVLVRPAGCHDPECAVAFDGSPLEMEQMVVTFKWMEGLFWSDGEPLTAHDSVFSFKLAIDPDTPNPSRYTEDRTASYEAIDDYTSLWTGLPGYRDSEYFANIWQPLPEHVLGDLTALEIVEAEESSRKPLGWGPYVIDEWVAGDHMTLSRNDLYWRADEGLPVFNKVVIRFVGENSNANIAMLLAGECDIVDQNGQLEDQSELLLELEASGQLDATFVTGTGWEHADFGINPVDSYERPDFFEDVRTRQGIAHCMDRQAVVDTVLFGQSQVIDTYIPPNHPLFNPEVKHYEYDPAQGMALLEEAGWIDDDGDPTTPRIAQGVTGVPDGTLLEFSYWTTNASQRIAATQILQASMAECGIKADLEYWNATEYFAVGPDGPIFGRHFDLGQFTFGTGVQPPCELYLSSQIPTEETGWAGQNDPGFSNEEFDAVCNAAVQSLPGTPEYEQNHLEAQRIFGEQVPVVPLYLRLKVAATRPDFKNFIMDATENSEMWNIEAFDFGE